MEATERLGGQYSPNLHPQCTHLVVQISFANFFLDDMESWILSFCNVIYQN